MKQGYDFSKGERGKFYHQEAAFHLPVYLEGEVLSYLQERAKSKGVEVNRLINDMLKNEIALIEKGNEG